MSQLVFIIRDMLAKFIKQKKHVSYDDFVSYLKDVSNIFWTIALQKSFDCLKTKPDFLQQSLLYYNKASIVWDQGKQSSFVLGTLLHI